jgi:antitoxin MazE
MNATVQKWGNSLGIRIPAHLSKQLHLISGSSVKILIEKDHISIYPQEETLDELLAKITPENQHPLVLEGARRGKEAW